MKEQAREMALLVFFIALIAGSMGCATIAAIDALEKPGRVSTEIAVSDEILAIGRPDAALARQIGRPGTVAFLGVKNTYLLFQGGAELEQIARGGLDPARIELDATQGRSLYTDGRQVWGELWVTYKAASAAEQTTLAALGFTPAGDSMIYQRHVSIGGQIYPALKLPPELDRFQVRRPIHLYKTSASESSVNYAVIPLLPLAVAADVALAPVYLGLGVVALVAASLY